jgi:Protein of unknown function (DUF2852)
MRLTFTRRLTVVLERLDDLGRGAWIALVVLGFWLWWPIGLVTLGFLAFGRHRQGWACGPGRWYSASQQERGPWNQGNGGGGWGCRPRRDRAAPPSGNRAFDEYRAETLQRLEEEQREFVEYLERLRQARDKSEFDAFMAERRNHRPPPPPADAV